MSTEIQTNSTTSRERPLRPKEVWAIRVRLRMKRRKRDLAMFNLAIDSKLRGCDFVSLPDAPVAVVAAMRALDPKPKFPVS